MNRLSALIACALLALATPARAANPFNISDDLDAQIKAGLTKLYDLKFDEALRIFDKIKDRSDEHPMVAFGIASVHWWRLSVYVLESDKEESAEFLRTSGIAIASAKAMIERGDPTGEGHLVLGGTTGLVGRWEATNRNWLSAYFKGRAAQKHLRKCLKINPEMKDAYMGLGIFDYYVAALPSVVRALAFLGGEKDPQVGLNELAVAASSSTYARTPSALFLSEIYSNFEKKPGRSVEILAGLRKEKPDSPLVHSMQIIAHYNQKQVEPLRAEVEGYNARIRSGVYGPELRTQARFYEGLLFIREKNWAAAALSFEHGVKEAVGKDPWATWSKLYRGFMLDLMGRRDEAKAEYRAVLKMLRRWGSHDLAETHLKKPCTEAAPQFDTIKL